MKQEAGKLAATTTYETKGPDNYCVAQLHCPFENLTDSKVSHRSRRRSGPLIVWEDGHRLTRYGSIETGLEILLH
jgi:hypothetical protein